MSELLDNVLKHYMDTKYPNDDKKCKEFALNGFKNKITKDIIDEKAEQVANLQREKILMTRVNDVKDLTVMAIIIGGLVGMLVNQLTDFIEITKKEWFIGDYFGILTLVYVLVFLAILFKVFDFYCLDKVKKIIEKQYNDEEKIT